MICHKSLPLMTLMIPLLALGLPFPKALAEEEGGFGSYLNAKEKATSSQEKGLETTATPAPSAPKKKKKKKKTSEPQLHQASKPQPKDTHSAKAEASRETIAPAQPRSPAAAEASAPASPFKFGGFADVRYTRFSVHNDPNVANANAESGFGLEDGAFYANYDKDRVSAVLDLAVRKAVDKDSNPAATTPNQSSNNNFAIGVDKSQLYVKYKITPDFVVDMGQFDTIYGVEVNDSKDRVFGKTGLVYDYTLPLTHTGAMLEYATHGAYAKAFGANPNNKGSSGSSTTGDDHTELGGAFGYANDFLRAQAGYMGRGISRASGVGRGTRSLMDFTAGTTLGAFSLDLEYTRVTDPSKNTLTPNDSSDLEKAGQGYLALASYKATEALQVGLRYEELRDDPTNASIKNGKSKGISVHYKISPELELRSEAIDYKFTNTSSVPWNDSRVSVGAVISF